MATAVFVGIVALVLTVCLEWLRRGQCAELTARLLQRPCVGAAAWRVEFGLLAPEGDSLGEVALELMAKQLRVSRFQLRASDRFDRELAFRWPHLSLDTCVELALLDVERLLRQRGVKPPTDVGTGTLGEFIRAIERAALAIDPQRA